MIRGYRELFVSFPARQYSPVVLGLQVYTFELQDMQCSLL
jgi:hypothetical protein